MKISAIKLAFKYITGGFEGVADYLIDGFNKFLAELDTSKKENVAAALNISYKVLEILKSIKWLCPTKWQRAYTETIGVITLITGALFDFEISKAEMDHLRQRLAIAVQSWTSEDDETCVDEIPTVED